MLFFLETRHTARPLPGWPNPSRRSYRFVKAQLDDLPASYIAAYQLPIQSPVTQLEGVSIESRPSACWVCSAMP